MKKILIAILMLTFSFSSYSQRKSKKSKEINKSYLVIKIFENNTISEEEYADMSNVSPDDLNQMIIKEFLYRESNIRVKYEFGSNEGKEGNKDQYDKMKQFEEESQNIAQAINGASQFGWQVVSSNTVVLKNNNRLHYIYMAK